MGDNRHTHKIGALRVRDPVAGQLLEVQADGSLKAAPDRLPAAGDDAAALVVDVGAPSWEEPRRRASRGGHWNARGLFTNLHGVGFDAGVLVAGGSSAGHYTATAYYRKVTSGGVDAGSVGGYEHVKPVCTGRLKPRMRGLVKLFDVDSTTYWFGMPRYNAPPTHAAAYSEEHAMIRFCPGTDTKLMASVAKDNAQTVAQIDVTPSENGTYEWEIDGRDQANYRFRARPEGGAWSAWVTVSTNTPLGNTLSMRCCGVSQGVEAAAIGVCYVDVDCY
jgi:hypothetical protein